MSLPDDLRKTPQWLVSGEDKVPRSPKTGGRNADVRDRSLYVSYEEAAAYAKQHNLDIGFALTPDDPFVVIDLDSPENPEQTERHQKIYQAFETYAELSRSGAGVHIWCRGHLPRGARRDKVEVYPQDRYIICTGRAVRDTIIADCQPLLEQLFAEVSRNGHLNGSGVELEERDALLTDAEVVEMGMRATNGEKFLRLCRGEWEGEYPSQSEADFALMDMFAFYSRSNEQCKRLFRMSGLGKRPKAEREAYLDGMLRKIRAEEPQPIDFSALVPINDVPPDNGSKPPSQVPEGNKKPPPSNATKAGFLYPPGFIGEIAHYIVQSSTRPVPEVGSWAAIGLMAGVMGRQFNISGTGLNQYLILLAKTGVGKEGGAQGIERLLKKARESAPVVDGFMGPGTFASGQAIIRTLDEKPSFVSVLGEFGLTLQDLSDENASSLSRVMRRVLLDLYTKSGKTSVLYSSAYSDREKNTKTLFAPAMTLMGESTPDAFYAGLSLHHIADGLIPRFLIIEYDGDRPNRNPNAFFPPPDDLVAKFVDRVEVALRMQSNNAWENVELDSDAQQVLATFDKQCDDHIRSGGNEGIRQLWNRAHLKALRLAALLAAADRPHVPVVNKYEAEYAVWLVSRDVQGLANRFEEGDVGLGASKQQADMRDKIEQYLAADPREIERKYKVDVSKMHPRRVIPFVYLSRRLSNVSSFRKEKNTSRAIRDTINDFVASGYLREVPRFQKEEEFKGYAGDCWFIEQL